MAESSLNIVWKEYQARVGAHLGWGRGALYGDRAWSDTQQFELDGIVGSGLRSFYWPTTVEGQGYSWSFLMPLASLTMASGASTVTLPQDFGEPEGVVTVLSTASAVQPWQIEWRNEAQVREQFSVFPSMTGPPRFVSLQPLKGTSPLLSSQAQLFIFPTSDQAYTLNMAYRINPDYLSTPFPYAYGGAQHAETIMECCLAVAEARLNDSSTVHAQLRDERLAASIVSDRRRKPMNLGPNLDRSDSIEVARSLHTFAPYVTYNGSSFG